MQEIGRFGLEIHVISNGVEKYVSLMFSKHLVFVDITQFIIYILYSLVKNVSEIKFKF